MDFLGWEHNFRAVRALIVRIADTKTGTALAVPVRYFGWMVKVPVRY